MEEKVIKLSKFKLREFVEYSVRNEELLPIAYNVGTMDKLCDGPDYVSTAIIKNEEKIETFLRAFLEEGKAIYSVFAYQGVGEEDDVYFISGERAYNPLPWNYSSSITNEECKKAGLLDTGDYRFALTGELGLILKLEGDDVVINSAYCEDVKGTECKLIENCGKLDEMIEEFLEDFKIEMDRLYA
ncbi:MAG: hypothetical protein RR891_02240 [Clostridium sp.]|uniref:hypothetical protein n=1 Tax=Clostridium sp. TaxID=1506 RepID=UPI003048797D